ncbi:MAG: GEVED domain-containing protein, partial [Thiotrichaceae bacterium]
MRSKLRLICLSPQFLIFSLWTFLLFSFQVHADDSSKYMQAGYDYGDAPASYASKPKHQVLAFKHTNGTTALDHYTTTNGSQTDQGAYTMHQTDSGSIFIGGRFSKFNGTAVNSPKLAKLNSSTFQEQGTFLTSAPNNDVTALASYRLPNSTTEYLIVGGRFTNIGGQARNRLAIINLATNQVLAWDANLASTVHSIAVDKERAILHVGGDFGYYQYSLANLASNPSTITPSQSHTTGRVFSIYLDRNSQQVFIGGTFSNFLNSGKQYFAVLDANTQSVLPNAPSANGVVYSISSRLGNRAYLIGDFTTLGNYNRAGLAAIDLPSLTVNDVWNPGHTWSNKSSDPGQSTADGDGDGLGGTRYGLVAAHILYADNFDVIVARSGMQSYAGSTISMVAQHMELGSIDPETGEYGGWLPHIPTNYTPTITAYHHLLSANGYLYVSASNDLLVRYVMTDPAPKVYLGDSIDMEATHTTSTDASGDASDDDGIIGSIPNLKIGDTSYSVVVKVTNNQNKTAYIRGWVDLNKNSVFDSTEANNANLTIPANTTALFTLTWNSASFFPIATGKEGQTFLRLRVSSVDPTVNEESTNNLIDGEVEDYPVSITPIISPIIYTPPTSAGKCQAKSVEQLDKFQYATATGSGASGMANLTYTPPDGTSRMMMVFISVERDHSPFNVRGDNFEINIPSSQTITNADIPTVTVNGQSMNKMSFAVEMYGTGNNYADAEISRSYYFYTLFDPAIPKTATPITITGLNLPKSAGDEMMVGAVTFGNVLAAQPIDSQIDRTNPFQIDLNVSPVIANLADQAFGTTTADNAVIAFGNGSKTENLTIGTGWTKLAEIPIANNAGGYKNDTNRSYSVNTEDDGHTFYLQAIKNVTTPQTASISSTSNLSGLGLQAFRLVPILCEHGDAPESYGNAYHGASGIRYLGSIKGDQEPSNAQNVDANGDDTSNSADEDGVTIPTLIPNQANNVTVKVNGTNLATPVGKAYLNAWIDLDGNGKFESTEQIAKDVQDTDGDGQTIVPVTATDSTPARTYARFRISASPGAASTGYADYGEVEDYVVNVAKTEIKGRAWHDK